MSLDITSCLRKGYTVSLEKGKLVVDSKKTRFKRKFDKSQDQERVEKVASYLIRNFSTQQIMAKAFLNLHVKRKCEGEKFAELDRLVHATDQKFQVKSNKEEFRKWSRWQFDNNLFVTHFDFVYFLLKTPLGSQMKIFDNTIQMRDGVPGVNVEGEWYNFEKLKRRFVIENSKQYRESFLWDTQTSQIYTFLDNGKGLQAHHPFQDTKLKPYTKLTDEEYERTLEVANKHNRARPKEGENRNFIVQIVTSEVKGPNLNIADAIYSRKHPWIRIIAGAPNAQLGSEKGDVFDLGFGWKKPTILPNATATGQFRLGDLWNYKTPEKRYVTNIAVTQEEAHKIYEYTMKYYSESRQLGNDIAFNLFHHNCSAFVHFALKYAGIDAPTTIGIKELLYQMSPNWLRGVADVFMKVRKGVGRIMSKVGSIMPKPVKVVARKVNEVFWRILDAVGAFCLSVLYFLLGGAIGRKARRFTANPNRRTYEKPPLAKAGNLISTEKHIYHLPSVLQKWQIKQPSTVVYDKPLKVCVVPPKEDTKSKS